MNRKIIIALIVIVLIVLVGLVSFSQGIKVDTQINFLSNTSLQNGDSVEFELVDAQGNKLSDQQIDIKFETSEGVQNFTIKTDSQGKGSLVLNDQNDGNYTITVTYAGDNDHNNCSAREIITIGDVTSATASDAGGQTSSYTSDSSAAQTTDSSSSAQSSSSDLSYDSDLNVYYDSNGVIHGGQNDGANYNDVKNNPQQVDEDGSLV
ncbi:hypothetical protein [Methanobrevibacter sp.]|uniref:hypothetical protein n=1 Tax=Methanobrevibacter sp. TaxID=66852 RepID=UPI00388EA373